jgi:hypothetical protein
VKSCTYQALSNGLDVTEGSSTSTLGDEVDSLVDTAHGRNINSLATDNTSGSNTCGVLTGRGVDDGIHKLCIVCQNTSMLIEKSSNNNRDLTENLRQTRNLCIQVTCWTGLASVRRWMISKACLMMRTAKT